MERLRYRSTSLTDLLAELHQRDLLEEAQRTYIARAVHQRGRARRGRRGSAPGRRTVRGATELSLRP